MRTREETGVDTVLDSEMFTYSGAQVTHLAAGVVVQTSLGVVVVT